MFDENGKSTLMILEEQPHPPDISKISSPTSTFDFDSKQFRVPPDIYNGLYNHWIPQFRVPPDIYNGLYNQWMPPSTHAESIGMIMCYNTRPPDILFWMLGLLFLVGIFEVMFTLHGKVFRHFRVTPDIFNNKNNNNTYDYCLDPSPNRAIKRGM